MIRASECQSFSSLSNVRTHRRFCREQVGAIAVIALGWAECRSLRRDAGGGGGRSMRNFFMLAVGKLTRLPLGVSGNAMSFSSSPRAKRDCLKCNCPQAQLFFSGLAIVGAGSQAGRRPWPGRPIALVAGGRLPGPATRGKKWQARSRREGLLAPGGGAETRRARGRLHSSQGRSQASGPASPATPASAVP